MENILLKLKSLELCMSAHPDNEKDSEFADRISDLQEIKKEVSDLIEWKKSTINIFNQVNLQTQSVSENLLGKIPFLAEKNRIEGILLGLKICKEMFAQGEISHENIYENEVIYKEELSNLIKRYKS